MAQRAKSTGHYHTEEKSESFEDQELTMAKPEGDLSTDMQVEPSQAKATPSSRHWQFSYPQIEGVPPSARGGHTAVLAGASVIIFGVSCSQGHYFGGQKTGFKYLNDTVVLDVNANVWTRPRISGTSPAARYGHTAVLAGARMVIFGGRGDGGVYFRDLHALDPNTMTWFQGPEGGAAPPGKMNHSATMIGSKMFVFGGWDGDNFFDDLHVLDMESMAWSKPSTTGVGPSARMGHVAVQVSSNYLLIQGGFHFDPAKKATMHLGSVLDSSYLNDLRMLDTDTMAWSQLWISGTPPKPCYGHSMNVTGSDLVVFGGYGAFQAPGDETVCEFFLSLNTDTMCWQKAKFKGTQPPPRHGHTATSIGPHVLVFGGWEASKALNEPLVLRDLSALRKTT